MPTTPQDNHDPADCHVCGKHAVGIGIGNAKDPRYLCTECLLILERIKEVRRFDPYELKAREGGMEAAGDFIAANGSDLGEYTEEQALMLCGVIWKGCADRIRSLIRNSEAPF
jgi:hypothetical protein